MRWREWEFEKYLSKVKYLQKVTKLKVLLQPHVALQQEIFWKVYSYLNAEALKCWDAEIFEKWNDEML